MLKKNKIKLISLAASMCVAATAFVCVGAYSVTANASMQGGDVFAMESGASLKLSSEGGIRFRVKMDEAQMQYVTENDNVTLHFLVAPHEFYNAVPSVGGVRDYYNGLSKKKVIDVDEATIYEEDGYFWANGCLTNILEANRELDFTFLAYTYDASTNVREYAAADVANVRGSLTDVLSQAVVYTDDAGTNYADDIFACEAYASWFGTEAYPIQINNLATYNSLVNKVNGGEDFSAYTINVKDTVPTEGRTELADGKALNTQVSYTVKFLNEDGSLYKKYIVTEGESFPIPSAPAKAATAQYSYEFAGWDGNGDGVADTIAATAASVDYQPVYTATLNEYTVTFATEGGSNIAPVTVAYGTELATFNAYAPVISGGVFKAWTVDGKAINAGDIVTGDTVLVATYTDVEGTAVPEEAVHGDFYQGFVALPADYAVGTFVKVEMEIFVTGKFVSQNVDASSPYYNQWATSSINWVDTVWTENGEVRANPVIASFEDMQENAGKWMKVSFTAQVRNYPVLRDGTGWDGVEMPAENAVYLFASKFKSAATFNYKNVTMAVDTSLAAVPNGTEKSTNANGYYQAFVGLPTDAPVGTKVTVSMEVFVTGTFDSATSIKWVDTVWSVAGGEANNEPMIVDSATMSANEGKWIAVTFEATVRDFDVLRLNSAYPIIDVSSYGNAVFLMAKNFKSANSFNYRNVDITWEDPGVAVPNGTQKSTNANGFYQAFVGLPTDAPVGTKVTVTMEIMVTGTYNEYTDGIFWVDTVWSTAGGEVNAKTNLVNKDMMSANAGKWIAVTFEATVRDFDVLRMDTAYPTIDTSSYGNAVFLMAKNFKSANSFNYRNVVIVQA